jgi:GNAT superfamily N-acetyltransferase
MRFREDWLTDVISVPYVPTLGPVHPQADLPQLFEAVTSVAGTGGFLPYDKDRRWFAGKGEQVITGEIIHQPGLTVIPTLDARRGVLKVYHYAQRAPDLGEVGEMAGKWRATYGAGSARLTWVQEHPDGARTRLMLKAYADADQRPRDPHVTELDASTAARTFPSFARDLAADGFGFLCERVMAGKGDGPVLVSVDEDRIVGAVGPLSVMTDAAGRRFVPPQYFAVHPAYRRRGHGRALWDAAMAWGSAIGAEYKVLQAQAGAPAERFYHAQGLSTLGFTCQCGIT